MNASTLKQLTQPDWHGKWRQRRGRELFANYGCTRAASTQACTDLLSEIDIWPLQAKKESAFANYIAGATLIGVRPETHPIRWFIPSPT